MQYDKPVSRRMSGKVPSLDLRATDSGTIAKSRDGSTAPSDALDGAWSRQVGERTGVSSSATHKMRLFRPRQHKTATFRYSDESSELQT